MIFPRSTGSVVQMELGVTKCDVHRQIGHVRTASSIEAPLWFVERQPRMHPKQKACSQLSSPNLLCGFGFCSTISRQIEHSTMCAPAACLAAFCFFMQAIR